MSRKKSGFTANFEEWCIKKPNECYGEMNYTLNSGDIYRSMKKYVNNKRSVYDNLENAYCVLVGFVAFAINLYFYIDSLIDFLPHSEWIFMVFAFIGFCAMLMPLGDIKINEKHAEALTQLELMCDNSNLKRGCRFYNNRVEFISCNSRMVYNNDNIKKIYEFPDGLYFFSRSGGFEYIPAEFFDRDFAYLVTGRLRVTFFEKYKRCEYMNVPTMAEFAVEYEFPLIEDSNPSYEFNYILDRKSVKKFTGCGRLNKSDIIQWAAMLFFSAMLIYSIFSGNGSNAIIWLLLVFNIFYTLTSIARRLSDMKQECEKYIGEYNVRFFYGHISVVSGYSVKKIAYKSICKICQKNGSMVFETYSDLDTNKVIIPYYAVKNVQSFQYFVELFLVKLRGRIDRNR